MNIFDCESECPDCEQEKYERIEKTLIEVPCEFGTLYILEVFNGNFLNVSLNERNNKIKIDGVEYGGYFCIDLDEKISGSCNIYHVENKKFVYISGENEVFRTLENIILDFIGKNKNKIELLKFMCDEELQDSFVETLGGSNILTPILIPHTDFVDQNILNGIDEIEENLLKILRGE